MSARVESANGTGAALYRNQQKEGATLVCGGNRYTENECTKSFFVCPTIFDNFALGMTVVREEIFGPVVTVQTFKTEVEAVALANDTAYGLASAVFTSDGARALRVIKEIRTSACQGKYMSYEEVSKEIERVIGYIRNTDFSDV